MATCEWALLCDYAFLDVSRKICLVGIFDRISAKSVPAVHHQAAIAMKFVGEPKEKIILKIEIIRPTGEVLTRIEGGGELGIAGTAEIQFSMASLPIPDFGIYAFNIYIGNDLAKAIGITVARPTQEPPER